jgi:hypothetical protein
MILLSQQLIFKVGNPLLQIYIRIAVLPLLFKQLVDVNLPILLYPFEGQGVFIYLIPHQAVLHHQKLQVFLQLYQVFFCFDSMEAIRISSPLDLVWVEKLHPNCHILVFQLFQLVC